MNITLEEEHEAITLEAIKNYHKNLNEKQEATTSDSEIRKLQTKKRELREIGVKRFNLDREKVNKWE